MSDRKRAVLSECASRTVSARRTDATRRVIVASAMAGRPMCTKLATTRIPMLIATPKAGSAKPATRSIPRFSTSGGRIHTATARSVSEIGHATPLET